MDGGEPGLLCVSFHLLHFDLVSKWQIRKGERHAGEGQPGLLSSKEANIMKSDHRHAGI